MSVLLQDQCFRMTRSEVPMTVETLTRRVSKALVWAALTVTGGHLASSPVLAQAVVQQLPNPAVGELSDALRRLGNDPRSLDALLDAGEASIALGDVDAAEGFYIRAQAVGSESGRVAAGFARIALARGEATKALELFDRAAVLGQPLTRFAAERGLAYDLVGLNARAQALYGEELARGEDAEITRRLALSHAIAGDQAQAEAVLLPLLQAQDLAAFRTRAFTLAIGGRADEAVSIAQTMLPARIAQRLGPYLRYMPRLTRAQQAAAANLGSFPAPGEIGSDAPTIAAFAAGEPPPARIPAPSDARLIPEGAPLGRTEQRGSTRQAQRTAEQPLPQLARGSSGGPAPATSGAPPAGAGSARPASSASGGPLPALSNQAAIGAPSSPVQGTAPTPRGGEQRVSAVRLPSAGELDIAASEPRRSPGESQASLVVPSPVSLPPAQPAPSAPPDRMALAEAFAEFEREALRPTRPLSPDAVDIARIEPPRDAPLEREPPTRNLPLNPSRHWVQVATGQDVANFRWDWRRITRDAEGLLDGYGAYYAAWGANNRLITGPFDSEQEAQKMVSQLAAGGVAGFTFTSSGGERVIPLP